MTARLAGYKMKYVKIYYGGFLVSDCAYFNLYIYIYNSIYIYIYKIQYIYIYLKLCYHKLFYLSGELKFISMYIELLYL